MALVGILSQIKLFIGPLVIQLVWYILKLLFTSVSVKMVDIYVAASRLGKYPHGPLSTSTSVNNCKYSRFIWLNGSMTLIRAETERYDIVGFPKVTTKPLPSGTSS